jgi:ankyrin repeat protein
MCGNLGMVKILLNHGANVECKDVNGNTPLHCAIEARKANLVLALVQDYKCDPNIKDKHYMTPLHVVSRCGTMSDVKLLIACGARVGSY